MPTKRRSTSGLPVTFSVDWKESHYCNGNANTGLAGTTSDAIPYDKSKEVITYDESMGVMRFNQCDHWRWRLSIGANPTIVQVNDAYKHQISPPIASSSVITNPAFFLIREAQPPGANDETGLFLDQWNLIADQFEWRKVDNKVFRRVIKDCSVQRQVSIANFLYELREVKKLFEFWKRKQRFLKNLANAKLNYSFGWKPFISDICSMLLGLQVTRNKLKQILANNGKVRQLRGKLEDIFPVVPVEDSHPWVDTLCVDRCFHTGFSWNAYSYLDTNAVDIRYAVKYSYIMPELSRLQATIRGFCDSFGVQWDPQIIWDAIPFSFVVDWFWDVGDWLNKNLAINTLPATLRIHDCCYSFNVVQTTHAYAAVPTGDMSLAEPETTFVRASWSGKRFGRRVRIPERSDLLYAGWSQYALEKVILGLALLTNTARKRPRKRGSGPKRRK